MTRPLGLVLLLLTLPGDTFSKRDSHFRISFAADQTRERGIEILNRLARRPKQWRGDYPRDPGRTSQRGSRGIGMVIRGYVHNGLVVLADGVRLPEGQEVTVLAPESAPAPAHSILDIPPVSLGPPLRQF